MKNFFEEKGYTPSKKILIFDLKQLSAIGICVVFSVIMMHIASKLDYISTYNLILILASLNLFVITLKIINYKFIIHKFDPASSLPLHFCSFNVILSFIGVVFKNYAVLDFVFSVSPVMALIALIMPEGDAGKYPHFGSFRCYEYYYSHTCLILVPVLAAKYLDFSPSFEYMPMCAVLFVIMLTVGATANYFTKGNYMYISRAPHISIVVAVEKAVGRTVYRMILISAIILLYFVSHYVFAPLMGL